VLWHSSDQSHYDFFSHVGATVISYVSGRDWQEIVGEYGLICATAKPHLRSSVDVMYPSVLQLLSWTSTRLTFTDPMYMNWLFQPWKTK
jgi:hypothetical protein